MRIVFASGNRGKYREMKAQLEPIGVELLFGGDMEGPHEIEETGETYADNALIKARAWPKRPAPRARDDSGLEAEASADCPACIPRASSKAATQTGRSGCSANSRTKRTGAGASPAR